jgi:hypothetical protein
MVQSDGILIETLHRSLIFGKLGSVAVRPPPHVTQELADTIDAVLGCGADHLVVMNNS